MAVASREKFVAATGGKKSGVPAKIVESLELGRYLQYGYLRKLLVFYGKELRIVLE